MPRQRSENGPPSTTPADAPGADARSERPSRSELKRRHQALQTLAEDLLDLPRPVLERCRLDDALAEALELSRRTSRGAFRRQIRHLANMLTERDHAALRAVVDNHRRAGQAETVQLHRLERWRERLVDEGDPVLAEFVDAYPATERQPLRRLVLAARRERDQGDEVRAFRALFRHLREVVEGAGSPGPGEPPGDQG